LAIDAPMAESKRAGTPRFRGHVGLLAAIRRALERKTLPGTVLLHGPAGCGKQFLAQWIARTGLCAAGEPPCDACVSCRRAVRFEHPDVHWHFPLPRPKGATSPGKMEDALEAARHERLAELRAGPWRPAADGQVKGIYFAAVATIRRQAHRRPATGDQQTFIVGDAEHLVPQESSPEAANALLKLLEEPPGPCRFILTSSRPDSLLDTIRSRALPIRVPPLPAADVAAFLTEERGAEPDVADATAALSQGSIGLAVSLLDPESGPARAREKALALLCAATGQENQAYAHALEFGSGGARTLLALLGAVQLWIRDLAAVGLNQERHVVNVDQLPFLRRTARRLRMGPERACAAVGHVEEARKLAAGNVNPHLFVSALLLDLRATLGGAT